MTILYLTDASLESVVGGLSPASNGVAGLDGFVDATGVIPTQRITDAKGAPFAGQQISFPAGLLNGYSNFPS